MEANKFLLECKEKSGGIGTYEFVKENMKYKYIPHLKKCEACGNIVTAICRIENGVMERAEQLKDPFYFVTLLSLYWDLEFDSRELYDIYDYACENELYDLFIQAISEDELTRFEYVYDAVLSDYLEKYDDNRTFLIESLEYIISKYGDKLDNIKPIVEAINK